MVVTQRIMIIFIGNFREKIKMWRISPELGIEKELDSDPGLPQRE